MVGERSVNFPRSPDSTKNIAGSIVNQVVYIITMYLWYIIVVCGLWGPGYRKHICYVSPKISRILELLRASCKSF
ncbi:unnamed protein product, partial [Sphagnum troendelagicum]